MSQMPAWITALAAIVALWVSSYYQSAARRDQIKHELLEHRRAALFQALEVIDDVWSNESFDGRPPSDPHQWNIQLARDADNQIRIYCKYPETAAKFRVALGLYNPSVGHAPGISVPALDDFRRQVAKELELPEPIGLDQNMVWITRLSGTSVTTPDTNPAKASPLRNERAGAKTQ